MKLKLYKEVRIDEYHSIRIYDGKEVEIDWSVPDWSEEEEMFFKYQGEDYFLSEFENIHNPYWNPNPSKWMKEFDGIYCNTYFSGILVKILDDCDAVQVFTFSSCFNPQT